MQAGKWAGRWADKRECCTEPHLWTVHATPAVTSPQNARRTCRVQQRHPLACVGGCKGVRLRPSGHLHYSSVRNIMKASYCKLWHLRSATARMGENLRYPGTAWVNTLVSLPCSTHPAPHQTAHFPPHQHNTNRQAVQAVPAAPTSPVLAEIAAQLEALHINMCIERYRRYRQRPPSPSSRKSLYSTQNVRPEPTPATCTRSTPCTA